MNTLENIQKREKQFQSFLDLSLPPYKLVCFGASGALKATLGALKNIQREPDYVCDNDLAKQGQKFDEFTIQNPEILFTKKFDFFVLITSIYYTEISEQLKGYPNVKVAWFYVNAIPSGIKKSYTEKSYIKKSPQVFNTNIKIDIVYDKENSNYLEDLDYARTYGIHDFIVDIPNGNFSQKYLDYGSYLNEIITNDTDSTLLPLVEAKYGLTAENYKKFLEYIIFKSVKIQIGEKRVLINSWKLFEKENLFESTLDVLNKMSMEKFLFVKNTQGLIKRHQHALILHLYHIDMLDEIIKELNVCDDLFDIYISMGIHHNLDDIKKVHNVFPHANIYIFENRGRDVLPFIKIYKELSSLSYDTLCKIHTKKSFHREDGKDWGKHLRTSLLDAHMEIIKKLSTSNTGAFVAKDNLGFSTHSIDANKQNLQDICSLIDVPFQDKFYFPIGTMFWCKVDSIYQLLNTKLQSKYFILEDASVDATAAHAVERLIGLLVKSNGYEIKEV